MSNKDDIILTVMRDTSKDPLIILGPNHKEIIRIEYTGDIYVKGMLVENDKELVDAMREFFLGKKF